MAVAVMGEGVMAVAERGVGRIRVRIRVRVS